jgi:hypothetical protein
MRYTLRELAGIVLAAGIVLSGAANNPLSILALLMAVATWAATTAAKSSTAIGLCGVCGWLLLAAVIACAFRTT